MTEARFNRTWGRLAKHVIETACEDLLSERKDIQSDADYFFRSGAYKVWARAASMSTVELQDYYLENGK